jgi:hypothetical protein
MNRGVTLAASFTLRGFHVGLSTLPENAMDANGKFSSGTKKAAFWTGPVSLLNMKETAKYRGNRVILTRRTRAALWLGCCWLLLLASRGFAVSGGIMVNGNLAFNGDGIVVDSFNSGDGESINGQYNPAIAGNEGIVHAGLAGSNSVAIGNAQIYGFLHTGLGASVSLGPNGAVGYHAWQASGGTGIELGNSFVDNVALIDVSVPTNLSYVLPDSGPLVTPDGPGTTQTFSNYLNLPTLSSNQTLVSVTTNSVNLTVIEYPGPLPGLVTNVSSVTTGNYPAGYPTGSVTVLSTNCIGFLGVTNDPGPQQCLTVVSGDFVTTADYPGPMYGLVTNTIVTPPCITAITNPVCSDPITSPTLPASWCAASGIQTNCGVAVTSVSLPAPGTWCLSEGITTNWHYPGPKFTGYTYYPIVGYTYTTNTEAVTYSTNYDCPSTTNYTYTYPATNYFTYANLLSYTWQIVTYTYPVPTYSYTVDTLWTYRTNYCDNILSGGNYFATNALSGRTIVTGPSTLVMASDFEDGGPITIAPGGSLCIYVQSGSCSININDFTNQTGIASNLVFFCAPNVTALSVVGTGGLAAVVDAPEADAVVTAGGSGGLDFSGALVANSLTTSGPFRMHYDLALWQWNFGVFNFPPAEPITLFSSMPSNGVFQFGGSTASGYNFAIQESTDLVNWVSIFTNPGGGSFKVTAWTGTGPAQCFFRTVYLQ